MTYSAEQIDAAREHVFWIMAPWYYHLPDGYRDRVEQRLQTYLLAGTPAEELKALGEARKAEIEPLWIKQSEEALNQMMEARRITMEIYSRPPFITVTDATPEPSYFPYGPVGAALLIAAIVALGYFGAHL